MSFSVWIKRLLIISLMLISLTIVLVLGRAKLQQNSSISSNSDVDPTAWSPAKVQLQAVQEQQEEVQDFSKSLTNTSPTPKVESKKKQADKLYSSPKPSVTTAVPDKVASTNNQVDKPQISLNIHSKLLKLLNNIPLVTKLP